jgi:hypothetical protein
MLSLVTLSLSLLLSFATAQSTAVTWLEPGATAGALAYAGAVLDSCPGTTVIALQCTSAGDNALTDLCGADGPVSLRHGATSSSQIPILTYTFKVHDHDHRPQPSTFPW